MTAKAQPDDFLILDDDAPEEIPKEASGRAEPWRVLIVDDDPEVHQITRLILDGFSFSGRGVALIDAYSAAEAMDILRRTENVALVLLDVVMETDDAGLRFARWIRGVLGNSMVRIVLRTGQPGQAPEQEVIVAYDINDYKAKTELTQTRLFTTLVAALRSYEQIRTIEDGRKTLAQANDVLEHAVAERTAELRESERLLRDILDRSPISIAIYGRDGNFLFANQRHVDLFGLAGQTMARRNPRGLYADPGDAARLEATLRQDGLVHDAEVEFRTGEGGRFWGLLSLERIAFEGQSGTIAWTYDITERRLAEQVMAEARQAAEASARAKSEFLAVMSHEIRTPMNGVLGMLEVMEQSRLDEGQRQSLQLIRESARSLLRIVNDILDFSKIEAGRLDLEWMPVSIRTAIAGLVDMLAPQARDKGLVLTAATDPTIPDPVLADPVRLRQILLNLAGNAIKFTERGSVRIEAALARHEAGRARISIAVIDTGIGISAIEQERLFQPFSQADASTTRRFGGTGLGLSIARRLATMMGGDITVDSVPGRGATFRLTLDLAVAQAEDAEIAPARAATLPAATDIDQARRDGRLVLVVDDHPVNRQVLVRQLQLLGYAADTAADGVEALAAWAAGPYALVLTDCHMPSLDGFELTRRIREAERAGRRRIPIVAVTANVLAGEAERCRAAGMDDYVGKPVQLARLQEVLQRWFPSEDPGRGRAIDPAALSGLFGDDTATIAAMLADFLVSAEASAAAIARAVAGGWRPDVVAEAHRLKGAARIVGAAVLGDAAEALESAAAADAPDLAGPAQRVEAEIRRVQSDIAGHS
ncbi:MULTISPECIES: hybrid sensor histidine kinase/response regulator [Inquilinus]|uniref:histidine kinase n=1 Tax=Inquilinus ginsengisoli TaxID=363840 RepID=A0ABU1JZM2_9PROT|nr:response regulator [Inquilinus ginsengisoli]MDR6294054.1 PAS domain S-box-containing protein [Inquilinus ginsengisoli]